MVRRKLVASRTEAQRAIDAGLVRVASSPEPKPATLVSDAEPIHMLAKPDPFVSRAGQKLDGALTEFGISVSGCRAVDVGASTGGFTDCLLQRGAKSVVAVDVGYGQAHERIRTDDRVTLVERTNIRGVDVSDLGGPFDVVVADLSFISLRIVAEVLSALGHEGSVWVLLIKPQFEVGRGDVGKGGIVTDVVARGEALADTIDALDGVGLGCQSLAVSSITGTKGNVEFVGAFRRTQRSVSRNEVIERNQEAVV